jgi:hypothetical protein
MIQNAISIRPFIGAKNFTESRNFYREIGFKETVLAPALSLFQWGELGFYLQDAYVKDWIENTMAFFQVGSANAVWEELAALDLPLKYREVKLSPVRIESWGQECFLHDPSGNLWHFGEFY